MRRFKEKTCFHCQGTIDVSEELFEERDADTGRLVMRLCQDCKEVLAMDTFGVDINAFKNERQSASQEPPRWH